MGVIMLVRKKLISSNTKGYTKSNYMKSVYKGVRIQWKKAAEK